MSSKRSNQQQDIQPFTFPELGPGGAGKVLTKHFTNLCLFMDRDELALLSFLIYQSDHANRIRYSRKLRDQYQQAARSAAALYNAQPLKKKLKTNYQVTARIFQSLITKGHIIPTGSQEPEYLINPILLRSQFFTTASFYNSWAKKRNTESFILHADQNRTVHESKNKRRTNFRAAA